MTVSTSVHQQVDRYDGRVAQLGLVQQEIMQRSAITRLFLSGNSDCGGVISSTPQPEASIMGNFLLQGLSSNGMYSMRMSLPPHQHQT